MRLGINKQTNKILVQQSGGVGDADLNVLRDYILGNYDIEATDVLVIYENRPQPSEHHTYHDGSEWIEDTESMNSALVLEEKNYIKSSVNKDIKFAKMVRSIFEVGKDKGVWSANDFPEDVKTFYQEMVIKLNRYDELNS